MRKTLVFTFLIVNLLYNDLSAQQNISGRIDERTPEYIAPHSNIYLSDTAFTEGFQSIHLTSSTNYYILNNI